MKTVQLYIQPAVASLMKGAQDKVNNGEVEPNLKLRAGERPQAEQISRAQKAGGLSYDSAPRGGSPGPAPIINDRPLLKRLRSSCDHEQLQLLLACRLVWNSHLRGRPSWFELTDVITKFILQRAATAKNAQFKLMYSEQAVLRIRQ